MNDKRKAKDNKGTSSYQNMLFKLQISEPILGVNSDLDHLTLNLYDYITKKRDGNKLIFVQSCLLLMVVWMLVIYLESFLVSVTMSHRVHKK